MGCLDSAFCPARLAPAEDWGLPDPEGKTLAEVIKIRDEVERKVAELLTGL
jgi:protein-tyrosine-phosphatase